MVRVLMMAVLLGFGLPAMAKECERPVGSVDVPDGNSASEEEMVAASQKVRAFVSDGQTYVDCMQGEIEAAKAAVSAAADREAFDKASGLFDEVVARHDSMVSAMKSLAESFNLALRAYNARAAE